MALYVSERGLVAPGGAGVASQSGGRPIVFAHGFTQNSNCWGPFVDRFADDHSLRLVDMPGHGKSLYDEADLTTSGELLADAGGSAAYVGYSMGGRIALHTALNHGDVVEKLVLIGVNPGLRSEAERLKRREKDHALAEALRRDGLEDFLTRWLANPLFAGLSPEAAKLDQRMTNRLAGLQATLQCRSTGHQESLWPRLGELSMPVLLLAGEADEKYRAINEEMLERIPNASSVVLPGGHAAHLQQPNETYEAVRAFFVT